MDKLRATWGEYVGLGLDAHNEERLVSCHWMPGARHWGAYQVTRHHRLDLLWLRLEWADRPLTVIRELP